MKRTALGMVPEDSPMYRLHPVTRLTILLTVGVAPLWIHVPEVNIVILIVMVWLFRYSRVAIGSLKPFAPLLVTVALFIIFAFTVLNRPEPDELILGRFLGVDFSYDSLSFAVATYFRIITTVAVAVFYFSTNRERELLVALRTLRVPFAASYLASLSLRSAGMFIEDVKVVRQAERARGLDVKRLPYMQRLKQYALYMVPLFSIAMRRTDEISAALTARGFSLASLRGKRVDYGVTRYQLRWLDFALIAFLVLWALTVYTLVITTNVLSLDGSPTYLFLRARLL